MARQKGTPKTGGRTKGTPNRATTDQRTWIKALVDENRGLLEKDLKALDPVERWRIVQGLLAYVTPRMQAVSVSEHVEAEYRELEKLLEKAPDAVIDALCERIAKLKATQDGQS